MKRLSIPPLCLLLFYTSALSAQSLLDDDGAIEFGCQFHATESFERTAQSAPLPGPTSYLDLMAQAAYLETQLDQVDGTAELWSKRQTEILIELAQVKRSIGDTRQARVLYEQALYNLRINEGVYSSAQLPIILDLMTWYMTAGDEFIDQLGDRAAFLYEKNYSEDSQILELVSGFERLIRLRVNVHFSYDRKRSIHIAKIEDLQERIAVQIERLATLIGNEQFDIAVREPTFYTRYDDLGQTLPEPEGGMDQVTSATGVILEEVQRLLRPTATESPADYDRAKELLDELNQDFDNLENIDRTAVLDFYADYYLAQENISQTIDAYEKILRVPVLRPDYQLRSLRALGQLYENEERWPEAIDSYNCWRQLSTAEDSRVFIGLANSYRKQEELELAIYHLRKYMETLESKSETADKNIYMALKEMYYDIDDFEAAAEITRVMTSKFR